MKVKNLQNSMLACAVSLLLATPQLASANIGCAGAITSLGVGSDGTVTVSLTGLSYNNICNVVNQGSYQMNPAACKVAYATLLANQIAGRQVTIFYNDPAITSCGVVSAWSTQTSVYFVSS